MSPRSSGPVADKQDLFDAGYDQGYTAGLRAGGYAGKHRTDDEALDHEVEAPAATPLPEGPYNEYATDLLVERITAGVAAVTRDKVTSYDHMKAAVRYLSYAFKDEEPHNRATALAGVVLYSLAAINGSGHNGLPQVAWVADHAVEDEVNKVREELSRGEETEEPGATGPEGE